MYRSTLKAWFVAATVTLLAATAGAVGLPSAAHSLEPYVGTATRPDAQGYWSTTATGKVTATGQAAFRGDLAQIRLNRPITAIAATPSGNGYWLVATDGGIFTFGDARFWGSTGSMRLNRPVVGMAPTASGNGYWLVAADGGIFTFGDARFLGSTGSLKLNRPIIAMAATPSGNGYWLVAGDGGVFSFGDADFYGSTGGLPLNAPIVGMASTPSGRGYWMVGADGGIFTFGDAPFQGSTLDRTPAFGLSPDGFGGYAVLRTDGRVERHTAKPPVTTTTTTGVPTVTTTIPTTKTAPVPTTTIPTTKTAPVPTTTVPTTTTTSAVPSSNPLAARPLWVDPTNPAKAQAAQWQSSRPVDAAYMTRMGNTAAAAWLGGWSGDITSAVNNIVSQADAGGTLPVMIAYNIPLRDCGQWSSGGAVHEDDYRRWVQGIANGIGGRRAVVVLEPDALAQLDCLDAQGQSSRLSLLRHAVDVLAANPNTTVYLDAGHPGWHSAQTMASRLTSAGVGQARGFALNVSNFDTTTANVTYGNAVSNLLGGKKYVVDTSRNGNGSNGEWCNPAGRALGADPTTSTGQAAADAYLWLKRPGESDGGCNGGPSAGSWWADYALGLARSAWG